MRAHRLACAHVVLSYDGSEYVQMLLANGFALHFGCQARRGDCQNHASADHRTHGFQAAYEKAVVRFAAMDIVRAARSAKRPAALIFGGETTVQIKGTGQGGRNQELVNSGGMPGKVSPPSGASRSIVSGSPF
jgi:hypothetical protein